MADSQRHLVPPGRASSELAGATAAGHEDPDLAPFTDPGLAGELDGLDPDERAQILARRLARLRPELDLYLMTEIAVEDIAGHLSHHFRRVFHAREGALELHRSVLAGVGERYQTPFFEALRHYSHQPTGVFHALPISQGKSIMASHWISDMVELLRPRHLPGRDVSDGRRPRLAARSDRAAAPGAQQLAAETFGARRTYFVTNGTSTANKIVAQALIAPGDIVLVDRNCHQSHHYGVMLAGAHVSVPGCLPAAPVLDVRRGAAPGDQVPAAGAAAPRASWTGSRCSCSPTAPSTASCTTCSGSWRNAWPSSRTWCSCGTRPGSRSPGSIRSTGRAPPCGPPARLAEELRKEPSCAPVTTPQAAELDGAGDETLLDHRLVPDPARARVRAYSTQSTHKTLTWLRQGSMIHVQDQDFAQKVAESFHEAYMTHTSTSPNYQILASLDLGRRQAALEGYELVQRQVEYAMRLRDASTATRCCPGTCTACPPRR